MNKTVKFFMLFTALSMALAGCGQKKHAEPQGQVAVKVNGQPIMAADFGAMSAFGGGVPIGVPVSAAKMKAMVDAELLRQAAVDSGLDKDEAVRAELAKSSQESPRRILALAYVNKQLSSIPAPTDAEVNAYYNSNPAQFSERRQYKLDTCAIKGVSGKEAAIKAELKKSKKFDHFVRWLKAKKIAHGCVPVSLSSAQADEKLLQKLKNIPAGSSLVEDGKDLMAVTFVQDMQNDPLTLDQAKPAIVKTLMDKKKSEGYVSLIKELRAKAKIEYVPPYAESGFDPLKGLNGAK
jgi:EpsD family peptidyl-prolyl cis-trans isomerase